MESEVFELSPEKATKWHFGLLSPEGKFYGCGYMGHRNLVCDLADVGILENYDYCQIEDQGWIKYQDRLEDECPMEFTFAFCSDKTVSRPAKEGEKSLFSVNGVYMIDENVEVYHNVTQAQIDFILQFKKHQNKQSVNFNWHEYTLDDFVKHVKENNAYYSNQREEV